MKESTRAVIQEMIEQSEYQKNNGPVVKTADELWKYSGKTEEINVDLSLYNAHHDKASSRK